MTKTIGGEHGVGMWAWVRQRAVAALVGVTLLLAGCGDGRSDEAPNSSATVVEGPQPPVESQIPARVQVKVTGAQRLEWQGEQDVALTRTGGPDIAANVLSGGFLGPQPLDDDPRIRFRWAFDLVGEYRDRPGTFTLSGAPDENELASGALLIFMRVKDGSQPAVFDWDEIDVYEYYSKVKQPCTLTIGAEYRDGRLHCPELGEQDDPDKTVALDVSWEKP